MKKVAGTRLVDTFGVRRKALSDVRPSRLRRSIRRRGPVQCIPQDMRDICVVFLDTLPVDIQEFREFDRLTHLRLFDRDPGVTSFHQKSSAGFPRSDSNRTRGGELRY